MRRRVFLRRTSYISASKVLPRSSFIFQISGGARVSEARLVALASVLKTAEAAAGALAIASDHKLYGHKPSVRSQDRIQSSKKQLQSLWLEREVNRQRRAGQQNPFAAMSDKIALTTYDAPETCNKPINPNRLTKNDTKPAANVEPIEPSPAIGANIRFPSSGVRIELMNAQC